MNKIHREFHSANELTKLCTDEETHYFNHVHRFCRLRL